MRGILLTKMPVLNEEMERFCKERNIRFAIYDGHETAQVGERVDLPKDYCIDVFAISLVGREVKSVKEMPDLPETALKKEIE